MSSSQDTMIVEEEWMERVQEPEVVGDYKKVSCRQHKWLHI